MPKVKGRRTPATRDGVGVQVVCAHCDKLPPNGGGEDAVVGPLAVLAERWAKQHAKEAQHRVIVRRVETHYINGHMRQVG